ncbi:MAG: helix-turn-helix transcriptional regulator [Oscillospiraceae bacterium]|jgi:DNA-binding Xre family transcriptional regulator|nr:helix-turn-helix transcriptional regulator [Oscillospiraceae bacterium]
MEKGDVSYKKLWKILIDKDMKKKDLMTAAHISATSMAKITRGENVQTGILVKICRVLDCDFGDIMEISKETTTRWRCSYNDQSMDFNRGKA